MATYVVMMGPPGAGKGTQAAQLEAALGLPQVSTGDLFRANLNNETELGLLAKTYMDRGDLVPDEVTVAMVRERLAQPDCADGVILDGFPRTVTQANALNELLAEFNSKIAAVLYIFVEEDVLVARLLKRGRLDDNEETIRNRMQVYQDETAPLLDYYRKRNLLQEIDGDQSIEAVQQDLLRHIRRVAAV